MFGWPEIIVIGSVAFLIFGAKRFPEAARSIGQGIKEFKKASQDGVQTLSDSDRKCLSCSSVLEDGKAKFCPQCGKPVSQTATG